MMNILRYREDDSGQGRRKTSRIILGSGQWKIQAIALADRDDRWDLWVGESECFFACSSWLRQSFRHASIESSIPVVNP